MKQTLFSILLYLGIIFVLASFISYVSTYISLSDTYAQTQAEIDAAAQQGILKVNLSTAGTVDTAIGTLSLFYSSHCHNSAESYFNSVFGSTRILLLILAGLVSLILLVIYRVKKIKFTLASSITSALLVVAFAFLLLQGGLHLYTTGSGEGDQFKIRAAPSVCF